MSAHQQIRGSADPLKPILGHDSEREGRLFDLSRVKLPPLTEMWTNHAFSPDPVPVQPYKGPEWTWDLA